jgi:hypothetical protein
MEPEREESTSPEKRLDREERAGDENKLQENFDKRDKKNTDNLPA